MKNITSQNLTPFNKQIFQVELTGEDLLHMFALSFTRESGQEFPNFPNRVCHKITSAFPSVAFEAMTNDYIKAHRKFGIE